jgi:hypothetical protein
LGLEKLLEQGFPLTTIVKEEQGGVKTILAKYGESLSDTTKKYLFEIVEVCGNEGAVSIIQEIEERVNEEDLGKEEKMLIFSSTAIARYSHNYWIDQFALWRYPIGEPFGGGDIWGKTGPIGNVVGADVTGGIAGAVGTGLVGGTDLGTIALAGAAAGSVAMGVWEFGTFVAGEIGNNTGWW